MSKFTSAYLGFNQRLREVHLLRVRASKLERSDPISHRNDINALCRGAVVLLSSHIEAFIKEIGEGALDSFKEKGVDRSRLHMSIFYQISKDLIDEIKDTSDPERIAAKLFDFIATDAIYWSRTGPFAAQIPLSRFNSGFSNPSFAKVRAYFNRFGYTSYKADLYGELKTSASAVVNNLNHIVATRNNIAHGDYSSTNTPSDLEKMTELAKVYCRTTDTVFARWCGSRFCSIRSK